jgi:hypothetical protein
VEVRIEADWQAVLGVRRMRALRRALREDRAGGHNG